MVEAGLFYRSPYGSAPSRLEYRLTEKGLAFYPVALCMWTWENRWGGEFGLPPKLVHTACGKSLNPSLVCAYCETGIGWRDMALKPGPGAHSYPAPPTHTRRRESAASSNGDGVDTTMFHSVDTFGDRWTALLVGALFVGLHRYDDINSALGIATNILADRLRRLLAAGVIEQRLYQDHPPRHEYHLTDKGWDLLQFTIAMHDWGTHWIPSPHGPGLLLRDRPCGKRLRVKVVCGSSALRSRNAKCRFAVPCGSPSFNDVAARGRSHWCAARSLRPTTTAPAVSARATSSRRFFRARPRARWEEFSFDLADPPKGKKPQHPEPQWRIPAERMKMGEQHIVPLSRQAVAILRELHKMTGPEGFLFPSVRSKSRCMSENTVNAALRTMGFAQDEMTGHGFRHMASTLLHERGYKSEMVERQLAHGDRDSSRASYNFAQYLPERRRMMQEWPDYLDGLSKGADVVPIGAAKKA